MGYWLKLYTDILDDEKVICNLSDTGQLGMFFIFLVAKKLDSANVGSKSTISFHSRKPADFWDKALPELQRAGIVIEQDGSFIVVNFDKRQEKIESTERSRQSRKKANADTFCNDNATQVQRDCNDIDVNRYGEKSKSKSKRRDREEIEVEKECEIAPNFYSEFSQIIAIPLMGGKELDYLADLQAEHGDEKVLEIAKWLKNKDPSNNSMWKALRAIDTAAKNWKDIQKTNGKLFEEWINGDKRNGGKASGEIEQASPAVQADTGNA